MWDTFLFLSLKKKKHIFCCFITFTKVTFLNAIEHFNFVTAHLQTYGMTTLKMLFI